VHGRDAVREYWTRQWDVIDPRVDPVRVRSRSMAEPWSTCTRSRAIERGRC
jgi:hypothetical protein